MDLAERLGILYGDGGLYDRLNHAIDWVDKEDGLNMNGEWKLDINRRYTLEEIFDRQIRGWPYGGGKGLEDLRLKGYIEYRKPRKEFYLYYYFPDNRTRHPFYLMGLKEVGDRLRANLVEHGISFPMIDDPEYVLDLYRPVPHWVESSELSAPALGYDLWAINWKTPYIANDASNLTGNPWLAEIYAKDPWESVILLNPATASRKGLADGDTVVVESRYGHDRGPPQGIGTVSSRCGWHRGQLWSGHVPVKPPQQDRPQFQCPPFHRPYHLRRGKRRPGHGPCGQGIQEDGGPGEKAIMAGESPRQDRGRLSSPPGGQPSMTCWRPFSGTFQIGCFRRSETGNCSAFWRLAATWGAASASASRSSPPMGRPSGKDPTGRSLPSFPWTGRGILRGTGHADMLPPYEALYKKRKGLLDSRAGSEALLPEGRAPAGRRPSANPPITCASELDFMKQLCLREQTLREAGTEVRETVLLEEEFLRIHLNWVADFCREVEKHASTDFYRGFGLILNGIYPGRQGAASRTLCVETLRDLFAPGRKDLEAEPLLDRSHDPLRR